MFVSPVSGDYRLQSGSPCWNVGGNSHLPADVADLDWDGDVAEQIPFDLVMTLRVGDALVDMGTYELAPVPCVPPDCDDGDIELNRGTTLAILQCPTFEGDGGEITGLFDGTGAHAIISGCDNASRSTSLVVHGYLDIQNDLDNNAFVVADDQELKLTDISNKDWTGKWVTENGATLLVESTVLGAGTWELIDDADSAINFVDDDSDTLTGDFVIQLGRLIVGDDANDAISVTTTGDLAFESTSGNRPRITVEDDCTFTASN